MELTSTLDMNSILGNYVALMSSANAGGEYDLREAPPFGPSAHTTHSYGFAGTFVANPTMASRFIVIQGTVNGAEDASAAGVAEMTETYICTMNGPKMPFWRILTCTGVQPLSEMIGKQTLIIWPAQVQGTSVISLKSATDDIPTIPLDKELSPEDRQAREKLFALAARIEHLYRTDEGFHRWYHEGIDEIESGHFVTFSEDGWEEE